MTSEVNRAAEKVNAAQHALRAVERAASDAAREASDQVKASFADRIRAAKAELDEAETAHTLAQDGATKPHKWEGRRVARTLEKRGRWGGAPSFEVQTGIVETVTSATAFAANLGSYRRPEIGAVIVRQLKKDGTPGKDFRMFVDWQSQTSPWSLETTPA